MLKIYKNLRLISKFKSTKAKYTIILVRHGESVWNVENRFSGWADIKLTFKGQFEAENAGRIQKAENYTFDLCYTSALSRAIETWNIIASTHGSSWVPLVKSWRLNERHYGAMTGFNKAAIQEEYGKELVTGWRRSFDKFAPPLKDGDKRLLQLMERYKYLPDDSIPRTESLRDCLERLLPFWYDTVCPNIYANKKVIIVAHGNTIRSLIKHLDDLTDQELIDLKIPNGIPIIYELDDQLRPVNSFQLEDPIILKSKFDKYFESFKTK